MTHLSYGLYRSCVEIFSCEIPNVAVESLALASFWVGFGWSLYRSSVLFLCDFVSEGPRNFGGVSAGLGSSGAC